MLNKEQTEYIDSLRITHPSLPDATLKPLFVEAGWSEEEISEAFIRYKAVTPPTPPASAQPTPAVSTTEPVPLKPRTPAQASPAKLTGAFTSTLKPLVITQKKSGLGKALLIIGIILIVVAILVGIYFYLIQKGHINEVMRTGDIIFKSILEKI